MGDFVLLLLQNIITKCTKKKLPSKALPITTV